MFLLILVTLLLLLIQNSVYKVAIDTVMIQILDTTRIAPSTTLNSLNHVYLPQPRSASVSERLQYLTEGVGFESWFGRLSE